MNPCPPGPELLRVALSPSERESDPLAWHIRSCPHCRQAAARWRLLRELISAGATPTGIGSEDCLTEAGIAGLLTPSGDPTERARALAHMAGCGRCRAELVAVAELLADPAVAAASGEDTARRAPPAWRTGRWIATGMAVAAASVAVMLRTDVPPSTPSGHRDPTLAAAPAPTPITPVDGEGAVKEFRWSAVAGADRYRVVLFDADGDVLLESETGDTVMALPDRIRLAPAEPYLWKVEARTGFDRWVSSDLVEFQVPTRPPQPDSGSAAAPPGDSLHVIASRLSDSALAREVQERPLEVRDALRKTLAGTVRGSVPARDSAFVTARRLADAYSVAWSDSSLVREVQRFAAWSERARGIKVVADSLRIEGNTVYRHGGADAAIGVWRDALRRSDAIGDTAGVAAALGNIGAAHLREGRADSAEACLMLARELSGRIGDMRVEANALLALAVISEDQDDIGAARERYVRASALHGRLGDTRGLAADYNDLAGLARSAGDLVEARRQLERALALNRRDGRPGDAATNLVNLAAIDALAGDLARGEALYREALAAWRSGERWSDAADALRGLGTLEIRRGDYPAARADLQEAASLFDRVGPVNSALEVREELARVEAAMGDLQGAVDLLRAAERAADSTAVGPLTKAAIVLTRADLAVQLNTREEAERLYRLADGLYRRGGDQAGAGHAQEGLGLLLLDQGHFEQARAALDEARRSALASGDGRAAALSRLLLGTVALQEGDTTLARRTMTAAAGALERLGDPIAAAAALGERAGLEEAAGLPATAESLYRRALATVGDLPAPELTWSLHAGLAAARRDQGTLADASQELRAAITDLERVGSSLELPERRSGYLDDKWDVYVELAQLEEASGRTDGAFDASERLRAGEMLEMLARGRVAEPADTAADLVSREQDLRRRIRELSRTLEGAAPPDARVRGLDVSDAGAATRESLLRAQEAYASLSLEIREGAPRHAALVSRETASWRSVAARLGPREALVEYLLDEPRSLAFVITRDTLVAVALPVGRRETARLVDFARGTLPPRGSGGTDSLWRAPLRRLYADLVAPVERTGLLRDKTRLVIVPHTELHYLPFAALRTGEGPTDYLVSRYDIAVTPSASVWLALGTRPASKAAGVLALAPRPDALPASRAEVKDIARIGLAPTESLLGRAATEAAFRREAPGRRVIHLATYGVLNKQNPLFSFVELAPGEGTDGRLEAHEVFGLHLDADLVVLSACQTGLASGALNDVPAGDDWIGLARAFLSAGAAHVMASLWPVEDQATASLMHSFYERYSAENDPISALAGAQRAMLMDRATRDPWYWSGFELVGGR